jgi:hypothetical protein
MKFSQILKLKPVIGNESQYNAAEIGLAAPTAPPGASGSPIYSPKGDSWLQSAGRVNIKDIIDESKPHRLLRADDGWYWGIPIKHVQTRRWDSSISFDNPSR